MRANKNLSPKSDFLDILFEGRNKSYGAYELRRKYAYRLGCALLFAVMVSTFCISIFFLNPREKNVHRESVLQIKEVQLENIKMETSGSIESPPPPPPLIFKKIPKQAIEKFTPPKMAPDEEISLKQEELKNQAIDTQKVDGVRDSDLPPPIDIGQSVKQTTKVDVSPLSKVDIPARFPGNWSSFLQDKLEYPEYAQEAGIQGSVVIRFVVNVNGVVSDVKVVSGPKELRDEAVDAIKKSGKWIPAEQSGKKVKAYKTQVITFCLEE